MADHKPTPIERTQLIEIALNSYKPESQNLIEISQLDHNVAKIYLEMGDDAEVKHSLSGLRKSIAELKRARKAKSREAEKAAIESASAANLRLRGVISKRERNA